MTNEDLPPHLRETNPLPPPPELQLPLEPLDVPPLPENERRKKDERPVDPFLRRG